MTLRTFMTRLIWLCVLPGVLVAAVLAAWHVADSRGDLELRADQQARSVAALVGQYLGARRGALQVLASSLHIDDPAQWPALEQEARRLVATFDGAVALADRSGRLQLHTGVPHGAALPELPGADAAAVVDAARGTDRTTIVDRLADPVTGAAAVAIVAPQTASPAPGYVLLHVVPVGLLQQQLDRRAMLGEWPVRLLDGQGRVLAASGLAPGEVAAADGLGLRRTQHLELAPWRVEVEVPGSASAVALARTAAGMTLAVAGALLAGVLGGRWAGRRLSAAIRSLGDEAAAGPTAGTIDEVAAVRRALDGANRARDTAEADRRDSERCFRASLEATSLALQVREAQLRGIFDSASDAIITVDERRRIVRANPAAARMFRTTVEQLLQGSIDELLPEPLRERHREHVQGFAAAESTARPMGHRAGALGLRRDGETFPIEGAISCAHVDGQRLMTVILHDITERMRAQHDLLASKSQLEAALESMNDAVAIVDADGHVLQLNSAFAGFFRFPSRDDCPRTMAEYAALIEAALPGGTALPPSEWPLARALRGETVSAAELTLRRRDTGERWAGSFSCAPIRDEPGVVTGAVMTARDITEIRRVRAELEHSHAELRRLVAVQDSVQEQERRRIARELHDDLQQTLAAILMEVTTTRGLQQAADKGIAQGLSRIDRLATAAIVSTRRIVNDLRPQMLQELGLVPALGVLVRGFGERSGLEARFESAGLDAEVDAIDDIIATCLYRVAQEALTNVGKHADARRVDVVLAHIEPNRLRLSVSDDGRGIARFGHRRPGSFGLLGMRERVHALGGTIHVAPAPGGGTRVEVEIDTSAPEPINGA